MRVIVFFILGCISISCSSQISFNDVSEKIYNYKLKINEEGLKYESNLDSIRKVVFKKGKLSFFNPNQVFITIEGYDIETGETYYTLLNETGELNLLINKNEVSYSKESFYSDKVKKLLLRWSTRKIKMLEREGTADDGLSIRAVRVSFNEKKVDIKHVDFEQFDITFIKE